MRERQWKSERQTDRERDGVCLCMCVYVCVCVCVGVRWRERCCGKGEGQMWRESGEPYRRERQWDEGAKETAEPVKGRVRTRPKAVQEGKGEHRLKGERPRGERHRRMRDKSPRGGLRQRDERHSALSEAADTTASKERGPARFESVSTPPRRSELGWTLSKPALKAHIQPPLPPRPPNPQRDAHARDPRQRVRQWRRPRVPRRAGGGRGGH